MKILYILNRVRQRLSSLRSRMRFFQLHTVNHLIESGHVIKHMPDDGNSLFRCVADQVYADSDKHDIVRAECMEFLTSLGIRNETREFDNYIDQKRHLGAECGEIAITVLSELYERPIHIYHGNMLTIYENTERTRCPIFLFCRPGLIYSSIVRRDKEEDTTFDDAESNVTELSFISDNI